MLNPFGKSAWPKLSYVKPPWTDVPGITTWPRLYRAPAALFRYGGWKVAPAATQTTPPLAQLLIPPWKVPAAIRTTLVEVTSMAVFELAPIVVVGLAQASSYASARTGSGATAQAPSIATMASRAGMAVTRPRCTAR